MDRYYKFKDGLDAIEIATGAKIKADYQKGLITITTKDGIEFEPIKVSDTYVEEIMELLGLNEMPKRQYQTIKITIKGVYVMLYYIMIFVVIGALIGIIVDHHDSKIKQMSEDIT